MQYSLQVLAEMVEDIEEFYCNPAFCKMTGYSSQRELFCDPPGSLQGPLTDKDLLKKLRITLLEDKPFLGSALNYRKDWHHLFG